MANSRRSSASTVLFAYCERSGADLRFALRFETAPAAIADADSRIAVAALNDAVERIARRDPAQYQWTYKRYTAQPPASGRDNPYRDLEHDR
jgi:Kdo2-lipid IVA lauroyltransferase/acyltransferase